MPVASVLVAVLIPEPKVSVYEDVPVVVIIKSTYCPAVKFVTVTVAFCDGTVVTYRRASRHEALVVRLRSLPTSSCPLRAAASYHTPRVRPSSHCLPRLRLGRHRSQGEHQ